MVRARPWNETRTSKEEWHGPRRMIHLQEQSWKFVEIRRGTPRFVMLCTCNLINETP
jgi:hypothetical protein